jgi:hypothetical protein
MGESKCGLKMGGRRRKTRKSLKKKYRKTLKKYMS